MEYPADFVAECQRLYPGWKDLRKRLAEGASIVGRYLDDNRTNAIDYDDVLAATSLEELQEKARELQAKAALYVWWYKLYDQQVLIPERDRRRSEFN